MNEFGEFFCALRKEKGMTQAEIARLLGVTNKAVSKWETGESLPDTSMLKPIADTFGVTVDELLNGKRVNKSEHEEQKNEKEHLNFKEHIFSKETDDEKETFLDKVSGAVCALIVMCGVITYLIIGAVYNLWHPYWIIPAMCGISCGIVGIIFDFFNREKRLQKLEKGQNPYMDGICGIIMIVCVIVYLILGLTLNLWHPSWIIFVVGGCLCGILTPIGKLMVAKK